MAKKDQFLEGAFILSFAGIIVKLMGAIYRIPLARLIGGEGMGLYQMAYPAYTIVLALSTAGIPVAISILVAERKAKGDYPGCKRVFFISLLMLALFGLICSALLYANSFWLASNVLYDERAFYPLVAIAPAIFIASLTSAFRGYFQGYQTMIPTALSQFFEQLVRVITVLFLAYFLLPYGIEFAAAGAAFGAVTGSIAALLVVGYCFFRFKTGASKRASRVNQENFSFMELMGRIITISIPLSLGGLVMPMMQLVDAFIVPIRLQAAGFSIERATELFGQFSGMANTLINLPTIITVSLAVSLVPAISEAVTKRYWKEVSHKLNAALWVAFLIGLPASVGLWLLASPIAILLYDLPEVGASIAVLAPAALLLGLYQTTSGALQGMGNTFLPVKNLIVGVTVKGVLNYLLIPLLGIQGAGIATITGFAVSFLLNYKDLKQHLAFRLQAYRIIIAPLLGAIIMGLAVTGSFSFLLVNLGNNLAVVATIAMGGLAYFLSVLLLGGIRASDIELMPGGIKLASFLLKSKIVRR